ncbi:MAG: hypothetical protein KatS3mg102_0645 [Planctomycetota bacterium]|nr:MAG: hypothetical protein KatS3mg102_0645 [Planctomycetota bacterium]
MVHGQGAAAGPGYALRASVRAVRALLDRAGSASEVAPQELLAHREDLLVIRERARALGGCGGPLAEAFALSEEVLVLIQRLALEEQRALPAAAPGEARAPRPAGAERARLVPLKRPRPGAGWPAPARLGLGAGRVAVLALPRIMSERATGGPVGHIPVLCEGVLALLGPVLRPGARVLDATVGGGGHAEAILPRILPGGRYLGLDRDPQALVHARARLLPRWGEAVRLVHAPFAALAALAARELGEGADAVLFDLGLSSLQLDDPARGFSFRASGPLDMRMDPSAPGPTAAELVNRLPERELAELIRRYGEERRARRVAAAIARARQRRAARAHRRACRADRACARPALRARPYPPRHPHLPGAAARGQRRARAAGARARGAARGTAPRRACCDHRVSLAGGPARQAGLPRGRARGPAGAAGAQARAAQRRGGGAQPARAQRAAARGGAPGRDRGASCPVTPPARGADIITGERPAARRGADGARMERAMRLGCYVLALLTLVVIALLSVQQQVRAVRAGYRLGTLEHERAELREQLRRLEVQVLQESRMEVLEERARRLGLEIPGREDPARLLEELLR